MKAFFKKQGAGFYLTIATVLCIILGIIFYLAGAIGGYYDDASAGIIVLLILGIILAAALAAVHEIFDLHPAFMAINGGVVAMIMAAFLMLVTDRVLSIGFLLGSELGSENENANTCLYLSLVAMAFMLIAVVTAIVTGFMKYKKDDKIEVETASAQAPADV